MHPKPVRQVLIPKPTVTASSGLWAFTCIRDRVARRQPKALLVLEPIFEADKLQPDCQYG